MAAPAAHEMAASPARGPYDATVVAFAPEQLDANATGRAPVSIEEASFDASPRGQEVPMHVPVSETETDSDSVETYDEGTVTGELRDAALFLLQDHMPILTLLLTLAFPLAASLGFLVPASLGDGLTFVLRTLPPLCVLAVFLHVAGQILDGASEGDEEPAPAGELFAGVARGAPRSLFAFVTLALIGFGPSMLARVAGMPATEAMLLGVFGVAYVPLAFLGLVMARSSDAAMPIPVVRAILAARGDYLRLTAMCGVLIVMPAIAVMLGAGSALLLQSALAGPLIVIPGFMLARCIGRHGYEHRELLLAAFGVASETIAHDPRARARALARQRIARGPEQRRAPAPRTRRQVEPTVRTVTESREIEANSPNPRLQNKRPLGIEQFAPSVAAQRAEEAAMVHAHAQHAAPVAHAGAPVPPVAHAASGMPSRRPMARPVQKPMARPVAREIGTDPAQPSRRFGRSAMPSPAPRSGVYPSQLHEAGPEAREPENGSLAVPPPQPRGRDPRQQR
ncbi:MAG: hypothetical protein KDC95_05740 [Planctomycetes bacterium]|nr:hypothetical protein [Planctomycetota bacterium]